MGPRFHFDEDAEEHALVAALRQRGLDIRTSGELRLGASDDVAQLTAAEKDGRVLVSYNVADFCRIHKEWISSGRHHAGIVLAPQQRFLIGEFVARLLRLSAALDAKAMRDRLEFLSSW